MFKHLLIPAFLLLLGLSLWGQCPDRDRLWNRILYLRDSSEVSAGEQLTELNGYLGKMSGCIYRNDSTHILLMQRIGWLYAVQKDFSGAIEFTNRSIDMVHAYAGNRNVNESILIKCYNNLVILYDSTGQGKRKAEAMDSCISLAVKLKTGYPYALKYINEKIQYSFDKGDYYNCLNYAAIGEDIIRETQNFPEDVFYYLIWKINALNFLKQSEEAGKLAEKSIQQCLQSGNKAYLGSLLSLKAGICAENKDIPGAIRYARQSLIYNRDAANYPACAGTLINLGFKLYFSNLHQYDKALYYYKEALKYAKGDRSVHLLILNNIANAYVQKGDFTRGFYFFRQAFNIIHPGSDESDLLKNSGTDFLINTNSEYLINLVLDKAEAYLSQYKQTKSAPYSGYAIHAYKVADRIMDKVRITQAEAASKLFWRTATRRLYERAIESCFLSGDQENAFYFFEKSRAVLLNDQLKEQRAGGVTISQLAMLKRKILGLERVNATLKPGSARYADIRRAIFINKQELNRTEQRLQDQNPWYYQSLIDTSFINLKQTQEKLLASGRAQSVLEFFNGDSSDYLLTILPDTCHIQPINKQTFETNAEEFMTYLSNPGMLNRDFTGYVKTASRLYRMLFNQDSVPAGRVIISPDGKYFPFEALITNSSFIDPVYFLKDHVVSYTYSVRYLIGGDTKNESLSPNDFLGMAPVHYASSFHLASLPESDISVKKIGNYFIHPQEFVRGQATKNNFMKRFSDYKIIQLFTHASDSGQWGEPVIYFADSALHLSELIFERKTAAQLIVLSACETGNGKLYKGEGVYSFNHGFAALGIPSSVINLWSVDNESSYRLTELFYKYVAKGLPLDLALQKAKLGFLESSSKEKKLPYYWAAFIIAGKTESISLREGNSGRYIIFIAGLSALIFFGLRYINIKRRRLHLGTTSFSGK